MTCQFPETSSIISDSFTLYHPGENKCCSMRTRLQSLFNMVLAVPLCLLCLPYLLLKNLKKTSNPLDIIIALVVAVPFNAFVVILRSFLGAFVHPAIAFNPQGSY